jgi:thiol-disulfide isomerase/thioredoxin
MCLLKNKILLILLVILCIFGYGCKQKKFEDVITIDQIFTQEEAQYYVYFFKEKCPYCEDCFEEIKAYIESQDEKELLKLYVCDLTDEFNSIIKRPYEGEGGQGTEGRYFVDGVTNYEDLYISGTPSIIRIDENDVSYFCVSGRKKVLQFIDEIKNTTNK